MKIQKNNSKTTFSDLHCGDVFQWGEHTCLACNDDDSVFDLKTCRFTAIHSDSIVTVFPDAVLVLNPLSE